MKYIGKKTGVCEICGEFLDAEVIEENGTIFYLKKCKKCGTQKTKICTDTDYYFKSNPTDVQKSNKICISKKSQKGCPFDCGICENHKQHVCMVMVETTDDCNIQCTTCIAKSCPGGKRYISLNDLQFMIDAVKQLQGRLDLLMLSGGEPTIHPLLFDMIELCKNSNIKHTMIISNGVRIANDEEFVRQLSKWKNYIEIYLQFDSLNDESLLNIRGPEVTSKIRLNAVKNLEKYGINYTLVCVIKKGVNDSEIKELLDFATAQKFARGVTFQPLKDIGRGNEFKKESNYITLSEARSLIIESGYLSNEEMIPHPCNGNCISIGYLSSNKKPITNYLFNEFENKDALKDLMYYLPYLDTTQIKYSELFRITIVSFLDKYNFTLEDVKRCCISFVSEDGNIVPFDTHYVYHS